VRDQYGKVIGLAGMGLYAVLAQYQGGNEDGWPSLPRLADELGCDVKTIRYHLNKLVENGLVTVVQCAGTSSHYTLVPLPNFGTTKKVPPPEFGTTPLPDSGTPPLPKTGIRIITSNTNTEEEQSLGVLDLDLPDEPKPTKPKRKSNK